MRKQQRLAWRETTTCQLNLCGNPITSHELVTPLARLIGNQKQAITSKSQVRRVGNQQRRVLMSSKSISALTAAVALGMLLASGGAEARPFRLEAGPVVAVGQQAHTFTCQWKTRRWTYKTTDATTFRVGRCLGSWSHVKLGAVVSKVRFHRDGGTASPTRCRSRRDSRETSVP
jgi:hypothetical protein